MKKLIVGFFAPIRWTFESLLAVLRIRNSRTRCFQASLTSLLLFYHIQSFCYRFCFKRLTNPYGVFSAVRIQQVFLLVLRFAPPVKFTRDFFSIGFLMADWSYSIITGHFLRSFMRRSNFSSESSSEFLQLYSAIPILSLLVASFQS